MEKIKLMADSAADIADADLVEYDIELLSVPITVDGNGYFERISFTNREFYAILAASREIPTTSRVSAADFALAYKKAWQAGYNRIIVVTINAGGSGTNASAHMGKDLFFEENPGAVPGLKIAVVDSLSYAAGTGYPTVEAAKMARQGKSFEEILSWLGDFFASLEIYLGVYSLKYAARSGRIGAAAAFVGEALGLKPIIAMINGKTKIVDKVRGEKQMVPRLLAMFREHCADKAGPVIVVAGDLSNGHPQELASLLERELGRPIPIWEAGPCIVINAGSQMLALVFSGQKRPPD